MKFFYVNDFGELIPRLIQRKNPYGSIQIEKLLLSFEYHIKLFPHPLITSQSLQESVFSLSSCFSKAGFMEFCYDIISFVHRLDSILETEIISVKYRTIQFVEICRILNTLQ